MFQAGMVPGAPPVQLIIHQLGSVAPNPNTLPITWPSFNQTQYPPMSICCCLTVACYSIITLTHSTFVLKLATMHQVRSPLNRKLTVVGPKCIIVKPSSWSMVVAGNIRIYLPILPPPSGHLLLFTKSWFQLRQRYPLPLWKPRILARSWWLLGTSGLIYQWFLTLLNKPKHWPRDPLPT